MSMQYSGHKCPHPLLKSDAGPNLELLNTEPGVAHSCHELQAQKGPACTCSFTAGRRCVGHTDSLSIVRLCTAPGEHLKFLGNYSKTADKRYWQGIFISP